MKAQNPWPEKRVSLHLGSLDVLISFLIQHDAEEVCLKSLLSPTAALQGERVRHSGVCVSACLYTEPGTPIAYATFLAGSGAWGGRHSRILYPKLEAADLLRLLPTQEAIERRSSSPFSNCYKTSLRSWWSLTLNGMSRTPGQGSRKGLPGRMGNGSSKSRPLLHCSPFRNLRSANRVSFEYPVLQTWRLACSRSFVFQGVCYDLASPAL